VVLAPAGHRRGLALAIAYTWLTEGTYDKEYVATNPRASTSGRTTCSARPTAFQDPGVGRGESGIPAREIRALAREWGKKKTMLAAGGLGGWGGACRAATGNEWARTMIALATMQGLGKPGSNIWSTTTARPWTTTVLVPGLRRGRHLRRHRNTAAGFRFAYRMFPTAATFSQPASTPRGQTSPALRIPEAMMHERMSGGQGLLRLLHRVAVPQVQYPAPGYPTSRCTTGTAARSSAP
jgi:pimeloyl-ACP methyl ester carboxylesterase